MARKKRQRKKGSRRGKGSLRFRKTILSLLLFLGAVIGYSGYQYYHHPERFEVGEAIEFGRQVVASASNSEGYGRSYDTVTVQPDGHEYIARVARVVDGDTLVIEVGEQEKKLRLLCVDTEESVHPDQSKNSAFGKATSTYAKERLTNRQVRIRQEPGNEKGKYGRDLAYVILEGDVFNVELVEMGFSPYVTKYGKSAFYHWEFQKAQEAAKNQKLGIWSKKGDDVALRSVH